MTRNKIVVRYLNGEIFKGQTSNFLPAKPAFHLCPVGTSTEDSPFEVQVSQLKAVFFVKDFHGNPKRQDVQEFPRGKAVIGRKVKVTFSDGETMVGTTQSYNACHPGFFLFPADANSNNDRCFVVRNATQNISFL
ncbi:MAG: hypothetical protein JXB25_08430 [Deltaproteobacteria bacterium]|nr:hypothetical protein [Deltaproteobacteria bacterium]